MIYVLSDIHGNQEAFHSLLEQINLQTEDSLYILGDVVDRGKDGIKILLEIMDMPNAHMLLGNHEYMMMRALGFPYDGIEDIRGEKAWELYDLWYYNGGGITDLHWKMLSHETQERLAEYLQSLPLNIDLEVEGRRVKLVHAAPEDQYEKYGNPCETRTFYSVWDREAVFEMPKTECTIVFGHTPTNHFQSKSQLIRNSGKLEIFHGDGLIGIDCGCGIPLKKMRSLGLQGRLSCIRLDDMKEFYSEAENSRKRVRDRKEQCVQRQFTASSQKGGKIWQS